MDEKKIQGLVTTLLSAYETGGASMYKNALPTRYDVEHILTLSEAILFPGFSIDESLTSSNISFVTGDKLCRLFDVVRRQVRREILLKDQLATPDDRQDFGHDEADRAAQVLAEAFLAFLPTCRDQVLKDVDALCAGDPAVQYREEVMLAYPGLAATVTYRIAHFFWESGMRLLARMMSEFVHSRTGIDIHPAACIGEHFYIDHGTGIVIGETTQIGDHVKIYQGVSLGALSVSRKVSGVKRHPTIENHVTIYAGATILGGETTVGHNSIIGGNVWLINSVPPHSIVENDAIVRVRSKSKGQAIEPQKSAGQSRCLATLLGDLDSKSRS